MTRKRPPTSTHTLRIIGGQWRGRRFSFPVEPGLRPTLDRFRETLFNWLMAQIPGAHCLDAFAGSGALGLEALSRGASRVTFIEQSAQACGEIRQICQRLQANDATIIQTDCLAWLNRSAHTRFDVVFLDPPYAADLLDSTCTALENGGWLADTAWIYCEFASDSPSPAFPEHWLRYREKVTKTKHFLLLKRQPPVK